MSNKGVKMWRMSTGQLIRLLHEGQMTVRRLAVSQDDKLLVLVHNGLYILFYALAVRFGEKV